MGRKNKLKGAKGDVLAASRSLDQQIEGDKVVAERSEPRKKSKRQRDETEAEYISTDLSAKILSEARKQLREEAEGDDETAKRMRHVSLGAVSEVDLEEDELPDEDYDDKVIELDPKDVEEMEKFMVKRDTPAEQTRTLYDIIQEKIAQKKKEAEGIEEIAPALDVHMRDMDPEVVEMYQQVGSLLSKYRSGKIPKAFKIIPKMVNWEQILYITEPDMWTAAAVYQATRIFASNLNPRMCQRFYNLVLLPRLRDDIEEYNKLNFHLYQALCKAMYRTAAFFKGIILPLCESGTCSLREATVFSSVLAKMHIPIFHAAAAMLKIAEFEYTGSNSVFLRTLIDKKYALPYKAINAIVNHFIRLKNDEREMPVLWHQCLLAFCQRYKNDFTPEQKSSIFELVREKFQFQSHYLITAEIRRELDAKETEDGRMVVTVDVPDRPKDSMEF